MHCHLSMCIDRRSLLEPQTSRQAYDGVSNHFPASASASYDPDSRQLNVISLAVLDFQFLIEIRDSIKLQQWYVPCPGFTNAGYMQLVLP